MVTYQKINFPIDESKLPISKQALYEILDKGKFDRTFPYINNLEVMYLAAIHRPNILEQTEVLLGKYNTSVINFEMKKMIIDEGFVKDITLPVNLKKRLFLRFLQYMETIPDSFINIIDDEDYFRDLANIDKYCFYKLSRINHPFKDIEEEIFHDKYEKDYSIIVGSNFKEEDIPKYVLNNSVVLFNTLKDNLSNKDKIAKVIGLFNSSAFTNDVVEYMAKYELFDDSNIQSQFTVKGNPRNGEKLSKILNNPKIIIKRLKNDLNCITKLGVDAFTEEVISYLKSINFKLSNIKFDEKNEMFKSPEFIELIIEQDLDNIKYMKSILSMSLARRLDERGYVYKKGDPEIVLNSEKLVERLIRFGDLNIILNQDVKLSGQNMSLFFMEAKNQKLKLGKIENPKLRKNVVFQKMVREYNNVSCDLKLKDGLEFLYSTQIVKNLNKLKDIFGNYIEKIIVSELLECEYKENKNLIIGYDIKLDNIFDNLDQYKFKTIYDKLYELESKFNDKFNINFFIKVTEYLVNNPDLCSDLNNSKITNSLINNLSIAINFNMYIKIDDLDNIESILKKNISNDSKLDYSEKTLKILFNCNKEEANIFLKNIIGLYEIDYDKKINRFPELIYLQLYYGKGTLENELLNHYKAKINLMAMCTYDSIGNDPLFFSSIIKNSQVEPILNIKVMENNILMMYANMFKEKQLSLQGKKYRLVNGNKVYDITGTDFILFGEYEFKDDDVEELIPSKKVKENFIRTSLISKYNYDYLVNRKNKVIYNFESKEGLIGFSNTFTNIKQGIGPRIINKSIFRNLYDLAILKNGEISEFDFYKCKSDGSKRLPVEYKFINNLEDAYEHSEEDSYIYILFDPIKHQEIIDKEREILRRKIHSGDLEYNELYKLIALSYNSSLVQSEKEMVKNRISDFGIDERTVLYYEIKKYERFYNNDNN